MMSDLIMRMAGEAGRVRVGVGLINDLFWAVCLRCRLGLCLGLLCGMVLSGGRGAGVMGVSC